mgnify:CR=1 FL=1
MFLIKFKLGHALLLPGGRFSRPRMSRDVGTQQPHWSDSAWPRQEPIRDLGLAEAKAHPRVINEREQSAIAYCPRPQARQRIVRVHKQSPDEASREQAIAVVTVYPRPVRDCSESASMTQPLAETIRDFKTAETLKFRRIRVSISPPTGFHVHIQPAPAYGHV